MGARWRVTGDQGRDDLGTDGRFYAVREITFELLDSGRTGSITVPLRDYKPEVVAGLIQNYADRIEAIGELSTG